MRSVRAKYAATLVASAAAAVACVLASVPAANASGSASWEPDPNSAGTIAFFNASGTQITSGSTAGPIAAFAVSTTTIEAGDNQAVLYGALPNASENTALWSVEQLSSATAYPVSGGPAGIGTANPVVTGAAGDESLATFAAHFPSSSNIYQIRLRTSSSTGTGDPSTKYATADVQISGSTWTEIYPKNAAGPSKFSNLGKPVLSGKHKVGKVETSTHGKWAPGATSYSYQWFKGSAKIKGATKSTLKLAKSLKGKSIHCTVTAKRTGYSNASASSKSVKVS